MQIINNTKHTVLSKNATYAVSVLEQTLGMLRYSSPQSLIITTRFGIHTFFMKYPIDIIILDNNNQVMKLQESLKPNKIFLWNPQYTTVIELPKYTIKRTQTKLTDNIFIGKYKGI